MQPRKYLTKFRFIDNNKNSTMFKVQVIAKVQVIIYSAMNNFQIKIDIKNKLLYFRLYTFDYFT